MATPPDAKVPMRPRTVLIVEDDVSVIAAYVQILREVSPDIIPLAAPTCEDARKIFAEEAVDLIILDLFLPDAAGTDMLEEIRVSDPELPVFMVTGYPHLLNREQARTLGITNLFSKPMDAGALIDALQHSFQGEVC